MSSRGPRGRTPDRWGRGQQSLTSAPRTWGGKRGGHLDLFSPSGAIPGARQAAGPASAPAPPVPPSGPVSPSPPSSPQELHSTTAARVCSVLPLERPPFCARDARVENLLFPPP
ncbi:hypothetical protein NDU88_001172 [Pleurodeles waltl]|uniref:Uncharacterized protein n=1 Tax=Pleurodeles waltl TaxID=8319 RepID=A0AAV7SZ52_PLEWA|nr:hypothetical protein NDU88_001172 [Pleurodeles waltl]